jgi:hypothetical protein
MAALELRFHRLQPDRLQIGNVHAGIKITLNKKLLKLHHNFKSLSVTAPISVVAPRLEFGLIREIRFKNPCFIENKTCLHCEVRRFEKSACLSLPAGTFPNPPDGQKPSGGQAGSPSTACDTVGGRWPIR